MPKKNRPAHRPFNGFISCRKYPISYLNMPKSACTTIKNIMYTVDNGKPFPNPLAIHSDKDCLLKFQSADKAAFHQAVSNRVVTFTCVREPFARAYSAFTEKIFHESTYSFPKLRAYVTEHFGAVFPKAGDDYGKEQHGANFRSFLQFAKANLEGATPFHPNPHWAPQAHILARGRGQVAIDLVGRTEKLSQAIAYVLAMGGYEGEIDLKVRYNEGPPAPFKLEEIMTDEIDSLLHEIYGIDRREFGYR